MVCKPYAAGDTFGIADLYTYYSMGLASAISQKMLSEADLLADYPQISELMTMLAPTSEHRSGNRGSCGEIGQCRPRAQ